MQWHCLLSSSVILVRFPTGPLIKPRLLNHFLKVSLASLKIVFNVAFSPVSGRLERSSRYTRKGLDQTVPATDRWQMLNLNSKILEDIVCDSLHSHLGINDLIHPNQWGFKKGVSTESLLLYLTETWKKAIDDGYKVGVFFADFKKAFDINPPWVSGVFHE